MNKMQESNWLIFKANEIPEWVDTSDWADKPLKGTKEHPLRAIAGAHSQIRRANQGNDMRMALVNTEVGLNLSSRIGCQLHETDS